MSNADIFGIIVGYLVIGVFVSFFLADYNSAQDRTAENMANCFLWPIMVVIVSILGLVSYIKRSI